MKIFGQEKNILTDIEAVQAEVDNLDGAAMRGTELALLASNYATEKGTDNASLASVWTSALASALANYTAIRAGYLDELDFDLAAAIAAIPTTTMRGTDLALLATNYVTERGTDSAALASAWTAALATALGNYTAVRAGYIDELAAANIPADIGENDDGHESNTLFGRLMELIDHAHTAQKVYPTQAEEAGGDEGDGITLTTAAGNWALGTITEIVPASKITSEYDIHEILIEDVNTQDKTYELVLYYGAGDTECGRTRFAATSNKGGVPAVAMATILIPANSRIRAQLAIQDGGNKTAKISLRYHPY